MIKATIAEGENVSEIQSITDRAESLSQSVDWWNTVMILALVFAAIAAIAVVVTTRIVITRAKQLSDVQDKLIRAKDAQLAIDLREKDKKIADAVERSAEANVRAAEANEKAEKERLARVKIEEKLAPRSLTPDQIAGLSKKLKPYAGISIDILQLGETPEITNFRSLIESPLRMAGLRVLTSTASGSFVGLSVGVVVDANDSEKIAAAALLSAFNMEGITALNEGMVKREAWPGLVMAPTGETVNKAPIRIYIGSKP